MKKVLCGFVLAMAGCLIGEGLSTEAHAQDVPPATPAAPTSPDVVTLKDGSIIYGEVIEMVGGVLQIKTPTSPDNLIKVNWNDVAKLSVSHPIPFHLKEGSVIMGTAISRTEWNVECAGGTLERHDRSSDGLRHLPESRRSTPGHLHR